VEKEAPIHASDVLVYCSKCNQGVRVGRKILQDGRRVRYCRRCGEMFV
jgi:large subunit ribosomal protein L24